MTLPRDKHRFVTSIAELAQDIMRHDVVVSMSADGVAHKYRPGLSGKILDKLYAKRLDALHVALRATPLGSAVVDFLEEHNVQIEFDHRMSSRGTADLYRNIRLNPGARNAELIGVIVHEARHIWQFERLKDTYNKVLPPEAHVAANTFIEADAFAFQQKYLEDYRLRTGDGQPLQLFFNQHAKLRAPMALDDTSRFLHFAGKLRESLTYGRNTIRMIQYDVERMDVAADKQRFIARNESSPIGLHVARSIALSWPFSDAQGKTSNYLCNVSDDELKALGAASLWVSWEMVPLALNYDRIRDAQVKGVALPSPIKKAPK